MKLVSWRNLAIVLALLCAYQGWRSCTHDTSMAAAVEPSAAGRAIASTSSSSTTSSWRAPPPPRLPADEHRLLGIKVPGWIAKLAPQPGEKLRDYRDRVLPLAELAVAPQRARVARMRDDFADLDNHQRAELDAAVGDAATAIQNRIRAAIASGELRPGAFKPMTGVTMTRELLEIVERGNARFVSSLTPEQRARLASDRFDFADYLLFSAKWEDALHVLD